MGQFATSGAARRLDAEAGADGPSEAEVRVDQFSLLSLFRGPDAAQSRSGGKSLSSESVRGRPAPRWRPPSSSRPGWVRVGGGPPGSGQKDTEA